MKQTLSKFKYIASLGVGLTVLSVFCLAGFSTYAYQVENHKRASSIEIHALTMKIENLLNDEIALSSGLVAFQLNHPKASFKEIDSYAVALYRFKSKVFRSVALFKDTTAFYVYPLVNNKALLGVDLSKVKEQSEDVLRVKKTGETIIAAPVKLVQGGNAIIIRKPMIIVNANEIPQYLGQLSIVIDYDLFMEHSGLKEIANKYQITVDGFDTVSGAKKRIYDNGFTPNDHFTVDYLEIDKNTWMIQYMPLNGWNGYSSQLLFIIIAGLCFSALASVLAFKQLQEKDVLNALVDERTKALIQTNEYLEQTLGEVEEKQAEMILLNDQLEQSLDELKETQNQLIQSEKFAALGELVAGVAHEINTPLGIGITLASYIEDQHKRLKRLFESNELSKTVLEEYNISLDDSLKVMINSLNRSAEIVGSFKNVAGEQGNLEIRKFNMHQYLEDVIQNLKPRIKKTKHQIILDCPENLEIYQYPGAFSHIITNFVINSLIHGFDESMEGIMTIKVYIEGKKGYLKYTDNGVGIAPELQNRIFDPYFTTKRSQGSTGLGLHIVQTVVNQNLKGKITMSSSTGTGVTFMIEFPLLDETLL